VIPKAVFAKEIAGIVATGFPLSSVWSRAAQSVCRNIFVRIWAFVTHTEFKTPNPGSSVSVAGKSQYGVRFGVTVFVHSVARLLVLGEAAGGASKPGDLVGDADAPSADRQLANPWPDCTDYT
jgi:hypothetical protein